MKGRSIWEFTTIINLHEVTGYEKRSKRKARIEQRRAKRSNNSIDKESKEKLMHDIDKPITLEDLTEPRQKLGFFNEIF